MSRDVRFDVHGRCVPAPTIQAPVNPHDRRYFLCPQPARNLADIHERLVEHLAAASDLSLEAFSSRIEGVIQRLKASSEANILHGTHVPFFIPRSASAFTGIGETLHIFLSALQRSFENKFPKYRFVNHAGTPGKLSVAPGTRHESLLAAASASALVGLYFPCLSGYSIPAAREQVHTLPEHFLLAGGLDTCAALIGSPDLLLRLDGYPPLLWLAALDSESTAIGYHFEAYGYNLTFNRRSHLGKAAEYWSSGLVVLG